MFLNCEWDTKPWLCLLLRADMIGHECEVPIWRDEREDTLRLPALKPHTRVETHVVEKTRILSPNKATTVMPVSECLHTKKHWATRTWTHHEGQGQVRHPSEFHTGFNHTLDLCKYCRAWMRKERICRWINFIQRFCHKYNLRLWWSNKWLFVPDLSRMASISSITSKYASLLVYLTPARLQGMLDNCPVGNLSPTLLPPGKDTQKGNSSH